MFDKNLEDIELKVLSYLQKKYRNMNIKKENLFLMNKGRFANATVFRYKDENLDLTIKDFSGSPRLIRDIFGRLSVKIEGKTLKKLSGNKSVTKKSEFLSPHTLSFSFIEGKAIKGCKKIPKEFFLTLEKNVENMHKKDIVHLDLRNLGNIIMGKDGYPYIIDFQSSISVKHFPKKLKNILKKTDITGVYKCWEKCGEVPLDDERKKELEDFKKIRKFWVFKGYPFSRIIKKIKNGKSDNKREKFKFLKICLLILGTVVLLKKL